MAAQPDDDIEFVQTMCIKGLASDTSVPDSDRNKLCTCVADEVRKKVTPAQRDSIKDARRRIQAKESLDAHLLQRTGLTALVGTSQDYCVTSLWPAQPPYTEEQHRRFSLLANQSVQEFKSLVQFNCAKYPKSGQRESMSREHFK
jgi:hypothetical protein